MNRHLKKAISFAEFSFIIFVILFVYIFVFRKMMIDMKYTDYKRLAGISMTHVDLASRNISQGKGFADKFSNEAVMIKAFANELETEKICRDAQKDGCWSGHWIWSGRKMGIKTRNNEFIVMKLISPACDSRINIPNTCGEIIIDTNGKAAPNKIGHDILKFYVIKSGIIPAGVKIDVLNPADQCDFVRSFSWGCTAKFLNVK